MAPVDFEARAEGGPDGLPTGGPIEREARKWFREQQRAVLGTIPPDMAELPDRFPPLADYDDPMSRAMTPHLAAYWQESGDETLGRLEAKTGLDLGEWRVTNPHLRDKIQSASLKFCRSTNENTSRELGSALADLKASLIEGLVEEGEAPRQLRDRVRAIFDKAESWKAHQIAVTEASRAVHAAQLEAAERSGVVAGLEWLLSDDACPICRAQSEKCKRVRLGQPFAVIGTNPDYSTVRHPPLHPNDQCTVIEILKPEYGGPEDPEFDETLHHDHDEKPAADEATPKAPSEVSPGPLPLPKPGRPIVHPDDPELEFDASARSRREGDRLVWADVAGLDRAWSKDEDFYIGPGGAAKHATKGKYDEAARFVEKARAEGIPIEMGEIHVDDDGNVTFTDGRHRFAVLRDRGLTRLPIAASKGSAKRAAKLYGTGDGERETN